MSNQLDSLQRRDPIASFMRILLKLFGVLFLLVGLALFGQELRFGQSAMSVQGTIIDVRVTENAEGKNYSPVVEFTPDDGRIVHFQGGSTSPAPIVGTKVNVLYSQSEPEKARIDSFVQRWLFPTVFAPVGLVLILIGCWRRKV